ncbi:hypothetical protein EYZ11_011627 [Aspergillus tanneri]|uniref:Uncharacterized protein n=1 Tax=Aspergillus tanneri TaxID=1220188 RepID=A0A4S3J2D3_9EURO|nr:hypothetical protein EYZ11_011627 [Aspergillus tanneri]
MTRECHESTFLGGMIYEHRLAYALVVLVPSRTTMSIFLLPMSNHSELILVSH